MKLYEVPIIKTDLRHEETIIQAADAFQYLNNVINDVFNKINERIDANNRKINKLNSRIAIASSKVHSLIGINKAINVFSSAKYPATEVFREIPMTFTQDYKPNLRLNTEYQVTNNLDPITYTNVQEKLQFYHVKQDNASRLKAIFNIPQGLGTLLSPVTYVDSFLLYNTMENPYRNYKTIDPLGGRNVFGGTISGETLNSIITVEAAPSSITNRKLGGKKMADNFFYSPGLNEAPEIDLPIDLPDLPGIADNISYNQNENEPTIAPSNLSLLVVNDLPILPEPVIISLSDNIAEFVHSEIVYNKSYSKVPVGQPPTPPMFSEINIGESLIQTAMSLPPPPLPPPIPPPPPPPFPHADISSTVFQTKSAEISYAATAAGTTHSNLMEAIRAAGGVGRAKLRRPNEKKSFPTSNHVEVNDNATNSMTVGGDFMADLHNKLLMRRKGISGAKDAPLNQNSQNSNVMDSISAMIPPPLSKSNSHYRHQPNSFTTEPSDEEDWD